MKTLIYILLLVLWFTVSVVLCLVTKEKRRTTITIDYDIVKHESIIALRSLIEYLTEDYNLYKFNIIYIGCYYVEVEHPNKNLYLIEYCVEPHKYIIFDISNDYKQICCGNIDYIDRYLQKLLLIGEVS